MGAKTDLILAYGICHLIRMVPDFCKIFQIFVIVNI